MPMTIAYAQDDHKNIMRHVCLYYFVVCSIMLHINVNIKEILHDIKILSFYFNDVIIKVMHILTVRSF